MKSLAPLLLAPLLGFAASGARVPTVGTIERFDPEFDRLVAPGAQIENLAEGFLWAEGPVWIDGALIFSDVLANVAYRWREGMTKPEVYLQPSGLLSPAPGFQAPGSNGLSCDREGRLLVCQQGERRIVRYENGRSEVLAARYQGKRLNSPNDLVVRRNGEIYFTDPPYGLAGRDESPLREIPFHGIYGIATDGSLRLLTDRVKWPNEIALSPDETILYVGVSAPGFPHILAFDFGDDGKLTHERIFFDARPLAATGRKGTCDGLKVDRAGNVWACGPGGVLVLTPAAKLLGILNTGELTANCAWGDDGGTLYLTAYKFLLRVRTLTRGAAVADVPTSAPGETARPAHH